MFRRPLVGSVGTAGGFPRSWNPCFSKSWWWCEWQIGWVFVLQLESGEHRSLLVDGFERENRWSSLLAKTFGDTFRERKAGGVWPQVGALGFEQSGLKNREACLHWQGQTSEEANRWPFLRAAAARVVKTRFPAPSPSRPSSMRRTNKTRSVTFFSPRWWRCSFPPARSFWGSWAIGRGRWGSWEAPSLASPSTLFPASRYMCVCARHAAILAAPVLSFFPTDVYPGRHWWRDEGGGIGDTSALFPFLIVLIICRVSCVVCCVMLVRACGCGCGCGLASVITSGLLLELVRNRKFTCMCCVWLCGKRATACVFLVLFLCRDK